MSIERNEYNSGGDYVLEYGELKFTFGERDFVERLELALKELEFIAPDMILNDAEREDLINLAVNGELTEPLSDFGEYIHGLLYEESVIERSAQGDTLVHWVRRVTFRNAWLDQRVVDGEIQMVLDLDTGKFVHTTGDTQEIIGLHKPTWAHKAYKSAEL